MAQRTEWVAEPTQVDSSNTADGSEILDVHHYDSERAALADVASLLDNYGDAEHVAIAARDIATFEYRYLWRIHRDGRRVDLRPTPEPKVQGPRPQQKPPVAIGTPIGNGVVYDDGGRRATGRRGDTGDCVTRAIAIATGIPYAEVYEAMAAGTASQLATKRTKHKGRTARKGINTKRKWFRDYMASIGWEFVPTMSIGSGCKVHLVAEELPAGRLIVSVAKHYTAVIDGVIRDTFDPNDRPATIYPADTLEAIPPTARRLENGNGWIVEQGPRCVYGYWRRRG